MKNIIKNIVAALALSGLFFVPFLSSAQTSSGNYNDNNNLLRSSLNNEISQAELEAIEEMQILEAKHKPRRLFLKRRKKMKNRIFVSNSNVKNNDRSQAEVEAEVELLYIQTISASRKIKRIHPIQASNRESSINSGLTASNYEDEISQLQNLR